MDSVKRPLDWDPTAFISSICQLVSTQQQLYEHQLNLQKKQIARHAYQNKLMKERMLVLETEKDEVLHMLHSTLQLSTPVNGGPAESHRFVGHYTINERAAVLTRGRALISCGTHS